jgi:hypothetical protein
MTAQLFFLKDAITRLSTGNRSVFPCGKRLLREIEIAPLVHLHSRLLAEVVNIIYHPRDAWKEWRGRIAYKLGGGK